MGLSEIVSVNLKRDEMMEQFYEYVGKKESETGYESLSQVEKNIYGVYRLETEINKRGFNQYFSTTKGEYLTGTLEFLQEIDAFDIYFLLVNGDKLYSAKMDEEDRMDEFQELDEEYFDLEEDMWEFYGKCIKYVIKNI